MNKLQLYRLLRKNTNLSYKRSPAFEQNKWAKAMIYFGGVMFAIYLIMYGAIIGSMADGEAGMMIAFAPVFLVIDYLLRFIFQSTPGMMVKPYILQPISRYTAIECFLLSSYVSGYNFLWLCMFVPYSIILLFAGVGFWPIMLELVACLLLMMVNSQIYLFFRTLINRKVVWFLSALAFYAIPFIPWIMNYNKRGFERMIDLYAETGRTWWFLPAVILLMGVLFIVNRYFQFKYVYEEISKKKEHELKRVSQFAIFNRFGLIGEYLKMRTDDHPALFVSKRGLERIQPGGVRAMLKKIGAEANVDHVHPHKFRRTLATDLARHGMPIQEVAVLLGHEKIDTTMRYVVLNQEDTKYDYRRYA